jgi:hypothetical protein
VDLAQLFHLPPQQPPIDRLPDLDLDRIRGMLSGAGFAVREADAARTKLKELRELYEPYVYSLSLFLYMPLPPWILSKEITDNWRTTAWGRITGFSPARKEQDDHD